MESCPPVFWSDPLSFYPALTGSKTPTSKFDECEEVRREITARKSPIGSTNSQCGDEQSPPLIKVSLYIKI
ncbi:hypothetical protein CN907_22525 [Bacillus anthracis]|nr:hypothetical protein CN907_22525 [Bacillus anthracis]